MADAASPQAADVPEKHNERSEKRSKHSSRDKERSSKDDHKTRSAKEHKHKHKSRERDRARGDREKRSNGDKNDTESSRDRDRHRRPRHDKAEPSGRVDAEPGELVTDAPSQRAGSVDRDAADGARAEAADFLRNEEAPPPQSLPPPPQSLPPLSASAGPSDAELGLPPLAGDVGPSGGARDLPSDFTPQTNDAGGEVSMSIEETNRMRVAMGLKPLKTESSTTEAREAKEVAANNKRIADREVEASAKAHRERISNAREKRLMEEGLRKVITLGAAEPEVDDISAWVNKSREAEAEAKRAAERAAAAKLSSMYDEEDDVSEDEEAGEARHAADLAGMRVKHSADDLGAGETVILTLADRNILDDKGDLDEEDAPEVLEDVQSAQDKQRARARAAAKKPAVEYDVDGNAKGMLSKYDDEEDEAGMEISAQGVVLDAKAREQADIRRKLAEGTDLALGAKPASMGGAAEYYTSEEMAAFAKPKRRVKKKLRKKKDAAADEEAEPSTAAAVATLEEAAAAAGGGDGGAAKVGDHGSRGSRGAAREADKAARDAAEVAAKRDRYEAALQKANYATLAASMADTSTTDADEEDDEVQRALEESMRRNRVKAAKKKDAGGNEDAVLAAVAERRRQEEAAPVPASQSAPEGERLTEAAEFARLVGQRDGEATGAAVGGAAGGHMDIDAPPPPPPPSESTREDGEGSLAMEVDGDDIKLPPPPPARPGARVKKEEPEPALEESFTRERNVGKGMGSALELMRQRGELGKDLKAVEWAGRTNDMKPVALQGLESVYTGGRSKSELENSVERALTRRDMHGRVLTPKEAFRELCHNFHGIFPSKDKQERQMQKDAEAAAAKRAATSENPESLRRLHAAQKAAAAPYIVLNGSVRPGQISDPASGFATANGYESQRSGAASLAPTPVLGGSKTPLVGDAKVQAMLGMKRGGGRTPMPPPPPRKPKSEA